MIVIYGIFALIIVYFLVSMVVSFALTRRYHLVETRSPAEVGLAFENVVFQASDGLTLRGWWIPASDSERAIIQLHGHGGSMDPDVQYLPAWHAAGFNVLMFDFRGHGRSQGRLVTFGYLERRDVQGAIRFLQQEKSIWRIALVGFSYGAMTSILSAPVCPEVGAVVADGGPVRIRSSLEVWGLEHGLPAWFTPFLAWSAVFGASLRLRANLFRYEPVRWVGRIAPTPLLLIHGDLDQYCPDFNELLAAAPGAELWRLPDVGHVQASQVYPQEYRERVLDFLSRSLI
jgi:pimeloyl-ACP methyl ester carboxylesterase